MLWQVTFLGALGAVITLTVSDAKIFNAFRESIKRHTWLHGAISCRYCFSHWVAAALMLLSGESHFFVWTSTFMDAVISWGMLVWVMNVLAGILIKVNE